MKKFFTLFALAAMAFASQANELTVADGTETIKTVPIYGMYVDWNGTMGQMIYPADMLTDMAGGQITGVKFYSPNIKFHDTTLQLSLKTVSQDGFETAEVITGATVMSESTPAQGDQEMAFEFNEPYDYEGGNLMVEVMVTNKGSWATTEFYGIATENTPSMYLYYWSTWGDPSTDTEAFLPKATFTYEPADVPVDKTGAPTFNGYTTVGIHAYFVEIIPAETSTIYYRYQCDGGEFTQWATYDEILSFTTNGLYVVEAYAEAPGKEPSDVATYEFEVSKFTSIDEVAAGKQVAGVRYFNMAGQEMQQPQGLTIVVTSYTDGTTSSVKVVK